jgi:bacillithiol biosynthesis deacetylase BshB1
MRNPYTDTEDVQTVDALAIAAHPDDVEQTCGGTLIKLAEMGYRTGVLDLTAGDMGSRGAPEIRLKEADEAGRRMLLSYRANMRMPDARLENNVSARMSIASEIRRVKPRLVILPYWEARHPDHYRACELGYEASFLAGLRKLDEHSAPHRPRKVIYSCQYANVKPSFVVDITAQFARRMSALFAYESQYGPSETAGHLFPSPEEVRERLEMVARYYGNLIGVKYGEAFVVKETMQVDDVINLEPRSF